MEFNPFDYDKRYVSHRPLPPHHHRDIHRHHLPPPLFNLPPPPPPLYPPLPPAPPPPPPSHHSNFTFLSPHHSSPRVLPTRLPEFDNPYPLPRPDPPRVSPYRPTSSYNFDSDRYKFIDQYRENRNADQNQSQLFFRNSKNDDIVNYDVYGYKFGNESHSSDFGTENRENYESRYGSVLGNERFSNDSRDEKKSWRLMDMEHKANDFVMASRERERDIYDSGRISNKEREEREEFLLTPKKKSVLLRIGRPNEVRNSRSYEKSFDSLRGKEKAHVVYSNRRIEEERERSPVDLDVSFKSNGLVAKAIVTDHLSPGKHFTPRSRKGRKVTVSSSPPTKLVEQSVRLVNSTHVPDNPSRSEKSPRKVENITVSRTISVAKSSADTKAEEPPKKVESNMVSGSASGTKRAVKRSVGDTVSDDSHKKSGLSESPSYITRKKKKVASVSSHASNLKLKKESEVVSLDNSRNTPLSTNQVVMHMEENIDSVVTNHDDIVSLPSPDVLNVNKSDAFPQAIASDMDNVVSNSGRSILLDSTTNTSSHLLDSLGPQENRFDKDTGIPCGSVTVYISGLDNVSTEIQNACTVSGIERKNDVSKEPCKNKKCLFLENSLYKGSSEGIIAGSSNNASLLGPDKNEIHEGCGDAYLAVRENCNVSSSDFGFKSITVSNTDSMDAGPKQSLLIEDKNLLQTDSEEAYLDAADISVGGHGNFELSKVDSTKVDKCTLNKYSSYSSPGSPSSSNTSITIIEGDKIVSTCPADDMGNHICLSGATIHENTLVRDCPKVEVPTIETLEVCSAMDYSPNVKRKRYTGDTQSDLSGTRTFDRHVNVDSPVIDEENMRSCSIKEVLEENDDSFGAGNLHAASQSVKDEDISVHGSISNELSVEVVKTGTNVDPDGASPIKKIKVFHNDEKTAPGGGSALTPNNSLNSFKGEKKELVNDPLIITKNASFPSQDIRTTIRSLKPIKRDLTLTRKKPTSAVSRVFTGPSSSHLNNSKRATPTNQNAKSRTWHRPGPLIASVPVNKTFSAPVSAPRISSGKAEKVQGSSYIRKGNSLVRKPGTVSAIPHASHASSYPVYRLNPSDKDDIRKGSGSENKVGTLASWLRTRDRDETDKSLRPESRESIGHSAGRLITEGLVATSEGRKTPSLPQINKSIDSTDIYVGECTPSLLENTPSDSCSEAPSTPLQQTSNVDVPNILVDDPKFSETSDYLTGLNSEFGSQRVIDKGKSGNNITYVKRKSNQLIATRNVNEISNQDVDKMSDSYYKRRSNQLIRASMENHTMPGEVPDSTVNSEGKRISSVTSSGSLSKRHFSKVWRLGNTHSPKKVGRSLRQKPSLFPWKRAACWQSSPYTSTNSSLSSISRKLLLSRKRDTIYTRSRRGFSLRISKLLSVGGSSLKWSKSIEKNSKRANEEATLAVAAVQKKKREQNNAPCVVAGTESRRNISRERVFRIGSVRYKMDPTRRTLQRISDVEPACSPTFKSEKNVKKSYVPRRLVIGNDEYVRIGNGNQLIRDPKKRTRALASEKIRWSLHTARLRLAKKSKYCQFFTRFGTCNKDDGKCPYIHDRSKIAVCTKYLNGSCTRVNCKLTHKVIPERMQDCSYYQQGLCSNHSCPYRHVNVNANASICEGFLKGYCDDGNECQKKHTYVCPKYEATGVCPQGSKCKLHHPEKRRKGIKRKSLRGQKNALGRYFGSRSVDAIGSRTVVSEKLHLKNNDDIFHLEGKFADYISLDNSDDETRDTVDPSNEQIIMCASDVQVADLDELIKPICVMYKIPTTEPSPVIDSVGEGNASYMSGESTL